MIDWSKLETAQTRFESAREEVIASNNGRYSTATAALTADYPQLEKDTWPTQDKESRAWVADQSSPTPWIDDAARERGLHREEYLRRTLVKARQFEILSAFLTGRRQRYEDQVKAASSQSELDAIIVDYTVPMDVLIRLQHVEQGVMDAPADQIGEALR
ncbi:hypothetical protein DN824_20440 [Stutzerimonas nosocomialis]|uniref:hypothetical protein n=1 Tax=Stutzerimonas nosocomialis TaxID=1056496 RepID=UPI001108EEFB|nr:hypothetical protein [Stutzerimonas nosocomialis]TLX54854.1 hypothetical protein DN824_20440 [Stutzerimonas nosocomialis]